MFGKHAVHDTIFLKYDHLFPGHMGPELLTRAYVIVHIATQIRHPTLVFIHHLRVQGDENTLGEFLMYGGGVSGVAEDHQVVPLLTQEIHEIADHGLHQVVESGIDDDGDLVFGGVGDEGCPRYMHELGMLQQTQQHGAIDFSGR